MQYIALLRGIGPGNPNMTNDRLRAVFEGVGFSSVKSVISSGNIVFESDQTDTMKLEDQTQKALHKNLGINGNTIIRTKQQIDSVISQNPFSDQTHDSAHYQLVTFFKTPHVVSDTSVPESTSVTYSTNTYICTSTDTTATKTPDTMRWLEKQYSKEITSRTFKTVQRISAKMGV